MGHFKLASFEGFCAGVLMVQGSVSGKETYGKILSLGMKCHTVDATWGFCSSWMNHIADNQFTSDLLPR